MTRWLINPRRSATGLSERLVDRWPLLNVLLYGCCAWHMAAFGRLPTRWATR